MPNGEYGTFLPTEAAYTKPGAYSVAARTEATKRAAYLSSMDQFYAQLEEVTREFEKTFGLKEKEFGLKEKELAGLEEFRGEELGLRKEELAATREWYQMQYTLGLRGIGQEREEAAGKLALGKEQLKAKAKKEPAGVPLDWLSKQLQTRETSAAPITNVYYGGGYQAGPTQADRTAAAPTTPTGSSTPGPLPSEFEQTGPYSWRN